MKPTAITAPALDIDKILYKSRDGKPYAGGVLERRIVANLIHHMQANGFRVHSVFDGEEHTKFGPEQPSETALKGAMELVFNLDEVSLRFISDDSPNEHGVWLILGNGQDIIADWNYSRDDVDGFNRIMEEFDTEDFA